MPRLPFKRKAADTADAFNSYIPAQLTDYTSLPPLEDDEEQPSRFKSLPPAARVAALVVPVLVVIFGAWFAWNVLFSMPDAQAQLQADPTLAIASARVVSQDAIVVEANAKDIADGTVATARLLANEAIIDWPDPAAITTTVTQAQIKLRMTKAPSWRSSLDREAEYAVELQIETEAGEELSARSELEIPAQLEGAFFGTEVAEAVTDSSPEPTPEPTPQPTPEPTPEATPEPTPEQPAAVADEPGPEEESVEPAPEEFIPVPEQPQPEPYLPEPVLPTPAAPASTPDTDFGLGAAPTLDVTLNATVLISPTLGSRTIGQVSAGTTSEVLRRTEDWQWYLIPLDAQRSQVGWVNANSVSITQANLDRVPSVKPDPAAVAAGPLFAYVFNGGNIRYYPNLTTGTVLGQLHAGQTITVQGRTVDGMWYKVVAPEASGWVHVSLILMDAGVLAQVPVAE